MSKAWLIQNKPGPYDDPIADVVKAKTRGQAIQKSELRWDYEYLELRATRIPALDDLSLTPKNLFWHADIILQCPHCEEYHYDDGDGQDPKFNEKGNIICPNR